MRTVVYCQHVLGMGHLFRTLLVVAALPGHRHLILGGPDAPAVVPGGVAVTRLPALAMDAAFGGLTLSGEALAAVRQERARSLWQVMAREVPDVFFVELYPFGRKAFEFELLPVLTAIREGRFGPCRVVCGLRDILVEKKDQPAYEARVIDRLERFFDAVLVHADPALFPLSATFSRTTDIPVPVQYTGYVADAPQAAETPQRVREALGVVAGQELIVASAGGGRVGAEPLLALLAACREHPRLSRAAVRIYGGPYAPDAAYAAMEAAASQLPQARVSRFAANFVDILAAADLSVSQAGYNTVMNLLATGVRALVVPFDQNREQRLRAERLQALGLLGVLDASDLTPARLAARLLAALDAPAPPKAAINLDGARTAATLLSNLARAASGGVV